MVEYLPEFFAVALAHLLAVASPGPDFAVVVRQSLCRDKLASIWTSVGIGVGIMVHVCYSLLGLGFIISQSVVAFNILKWLGALYLLWIGWQCLRAKPAAISEPEDPAVVPPNTSYWQAFRLGFLTNVLNPKATLFFVALFSVIVAPETPKAVQLLYGGWMVFATTAWFVGLSLLLSHPIVKQSIQKSAHWIERAMGVILVGLAARLFATTHQ